MPHLLVLHCLVYSSLGQPSSVIEVARSDSLHEITIPHITIPHITDKLDWPVHRIHEPSNDAIQMTTTHSHYNPSLHAAMGLTTTHSKVKHITGKQVWYFISKNQPGLRRSYPLRQAILCWLATYHKYLAARFWRFCSRSASRLHSLCSSVPRTRNCATLLLIVTSVVLKKPSTPKSTK